MLYFWKNGDVIVVRYDWFGNIISCKCRMGEQLFSHVDIGGDILICKWETMRVLGYLWWNGVMRLTEKQRTDPWHFSILLLWLRQQQRPSDLCQRIFPSFSPQRTRVITRLPWMRGWGWYRDTVVVLCFTETTLACEASASSHTVFCCWALLQPGARQAWLSSWLCSTILINSSWEFWLANHSDYPSWQSKPGRFPQVSSKEQIRSVDVST